MKKRIVFFLMLLSIIIILFGFLYFIGIVNLFDSNIFNNIKWLEFDKTIAIFYLIVLSIFLLLTLAIMFRIIMSLKQDNIQLTSLDVDDISVNKEKDDHISSSYNELLSSLNKNIDAIQEYTDVIDNDIDNIDRMKEEGSIKQSIDNLYQDFSHMTNDLIMTSTVSELFERIVSWGVELSNSKRGSIMVVDKNKELYIYKAIGWNEDERKNIKNIKIPLGSGISGKVASENKRIFVTNIENYGDHDFKFKDKYQTKSFISLPIYGVKKVVAVLNLTESKKGFYSMNDLEILNIITKLSSKIYELIQLKKRVIK